MKKIIFNTIFILFIVGFLNAQQISKRNNYIKSYSSNKNFDVINSYQISKNKAYNYTNLAENTFQKKLKLLQNAKPFNHNIQSLDSLKMQIWDSNTNQWIFISKGDYFYDNNRNIAKFVSYARSEDLSSWIYFSKAEWLYDNNSNMIQEIDYSWNGYTNQWAGINKYNFSYDSLGNRIQFFGYYLNDSTNQWINESKIEYTYNSYGNMIQEYCWTYDIVNNQWTNRYKNDNTFDSNGNILQETYSYWDLITNQWISRSIFEWTYDTNGNIIQYLVRNLDVSTTQFVPFKKEEYTYDANRNKIQSINYNWDRTTNQWIIKAKFDWIYDSNGNMIQDFNYRWDEIAGQWVKDTKDDYIYDLSHNLSDIITPSVDIINWWPGYSNNITNKPIEYSYYNWNEDSSMWIIGYKFLYYYSDIISNTNETYNEISRVFPNPFSDYLSFNFLNNYNQIIFELFDAQGRCVINREIKKSEIINTKWLTKGIYFYNLFTDGKKQSGKLIMK